MNKYIVFLSLFFSTITFTTAYCQGVTQNNQIKTVIGTVTKMDFVGNTISISTDDQHQLSFFVPSNAIITRNTKDVGLMDVKGGHPVTIQYEISSPGKFVVDSITDNKPTADETINE